MYREILPILSCPCCHKEFRLHVGKEEDGEILEGFVRCEEGHRYAIHEGVLDFGSLEQCDSNAWSEYYQEMSYEELDQEIEGRKSEEQKRIQEKLLSDILRKTRSLEKGFLLDVASGRGMLLEKLLPEMNEDVHLIASDLSFAVLMYDRKKFQVLHPRCKISYVACDATNLPFASGSIDMLCTFAGYLNMLTLFEKGVEEGARVLKKGASFLNTLIYMKEESSGYEEVKRILEENGYGVVADHLLREKVLALHRSYFSVVKDEISHEGIAEKMEGDLLPYPGEWFANALVEAERL